MRLSRLCTMGGPSTHPCRVEDTRAAHVRDPNASVSAQGLERLANTDACARHEACSCTRYPLNSGAATMPRLDTSNPVARLMIETIGGRRTPRITVESDTFSNGREIPHANSDY